MNSPLFLGRPEFEPKPYTRIAPVFLAEEGAWRIYNLGREGLPTEGKVFAPRLSGFGSRSLVAFGIEPNERYDQGRDRYLVSDPREVYEVLDYRKADAETARRQLVEDGLPHPLDGPEHVVAALPGGLCVVVKMVRHPFLDRWVADLNGLEHLSTHVFDERLFEGDRIEGRWMTVPEVTVGAPTGLVDWRRDADFLEAVLKRLRKAGPQVSGSLTLTQITQIVTQLDRADLLPIGAADCEPMRDRLRSFASRLDRNIRALDEIAELLGASPAVRDRLDAELSERRAELEREIRKELEDKFLGELEASFADLAQERDRLAREVEALENERGAKRDELDELDRSLEVSRYAIANDLTQLLQELGEEPLAEDTGLARLGQRLAATLGEAGASFEIAARGGPPWTTTLRSMAELKPWSEFDKVVKATAERWGYIADDLTAADVAARGGGLVILPEASASRFVACYSEVVSGGGYGRHVLDPSVISLDDLWRLPGSDRYGCFARAWSRAKVDPCRFQLILMDGLHRTPTALWMSGLLDVLRDPRRPRNLLVFASLGEPPIDAFRALRYPIEGMVALAPVVKEGLTTGYLFRAAGKTPPVARFDPTLAPKPTAEEIIKFATSLEQRTPAGVLEIACELHQAAWPFGSERAANLGYAVAGLGDQAPTALAEGAAWLRERLQDND
ncbi:hypothetical protein V5F31_08230 [Xanthobacter sp. V7C-4]|uniref:hypothetical protein n=1 Tax=Xanthobacter autotrophicus (strain ATCC BAA-1158 / Py2) TaxID=78245 RepID=UPI00372A4A0C